jgi:hypothetical protein
MNHACWSKNRICRSKQCADGEDGEDKHCEDGEGEHCEDEEAYEGDDANDNYTDEGKSMNGKGKGKAQLDKRRQERLLTLSISRSMHVALTCLDATTVLSFQAAMASSFQTAMASSFQTAMASSFQTAMVLSFRRR